MLSAHLDSDNLNQEDLASLALDGDFLRFNGWVGLDCKTGVAIILSVVERLRLFGSWAPWSLHIIFTIGEEAGQKGAIRAPLARLLAGRVRYGLVIDRMTRGSGAPVNEQGECVRHAVGTYKDVPLMDPDSREEMIAHLNAGMGKARAQTGAGEPLPLIESPNNADALEWRGRWDAEILGVALLANPDTHTPELKAALQRYASATETVLEMMEDVAPERRVSSMYGEPRRSRYRAMEEVYDTTHSKPVTDASLWFSCVNLSYDYSDNDNSVSIAELDVTVRIVLGFIESAYDIQPRERDCSDLEECF